MLTQYWYQIGNLNVPSTWLAFLAAGLLTGIIREVKGPISTEFLIQQLAR